MVVFSYEFFQTFNRFVFTFRFTIRFEFTFIYAKPCESKFVCLFVGLFITYVYPTVPAPFVKKTTFCSTELPLDLCRKSVLHWVRFLGLPNKVPQTWWPKTAEIHSLAVLQVQSLLLPPASGSWNPAVVHAIWNWFNVTGVRLGHTLIRIQMKKGGTTALHTVGGMLHSG